jgi:hypothetical protein
MTFVILIIVVLALMIAAILFIRKRRIDEQMQETLDPDAKQAFQNSQSQAPFIDASRISIDGMNKGLFTDEGSYILPSQWKSDGLSKNKYVILL